MVQIPENDLNDLYHIALDTLRVYRQDDIIIVYVSTNSAAGYYECTWVIKNGAYEGRHLYFGL